MNSILRIASVSALSLLGIAFTTSAYAYVYGNPPTSVNAITTAQQICSGAAITSLGSNTGTGVAPSWTTLAWSYLDGSLLPADYNNGSYCIDAILTTTTGDGGGGGGVEAAALLALGGNQSTWTITYTLHTGTGVQAYSRGYTLTYTPPTQTTASLSASPSSITSGNYSLLTWSSTNATSCTGTGFNTGGATSGSVSVAPGSTTSYSVSCTGAGGTATKSATVTVAAATAPPSITSFTATPSAVGSGGAVTISWGSANAEYCSSSQFDTQGATTGSVTVNPTTSTTYTITCTGASGTGTGTWQYQRSDLTDLSCPWTDHTRPYSGMSTCSQTPLSGSSCTNPPDKNCKVNTSGGGNGSSCIVATDVYACVITTPPPSVSQSATVDVRASAPTATLSANPAAIASGGSSTLSWSSTNAASCSADAFATGGATSGSASVSPTSTTPYTVTCDPTTGTSGGATFAGGEWWTGGTQTVLFQETVADNGEQGGLCASAAGGYDAWNASITRYPYRCGDAGCDLALVKCWGINGPTGTADAPVTQGGNCSTGSTSCNETGYFRSVSSGVVGAPSAEATATVTVGSTLSVSCSASPTTIATGQPVTWTAHAAGGGGSYTYSWSGTDGLAGSSQSVQKTYASAGTKTASVTVFSPHIASVEKADRFALESLWKVVSALFVPTAHALTSGTCGGSFVGGGDADCDTVVGGDGNSPPPGGAYDYVTVACDADSDPDDGTVTVTSTDPTATLSNNGPLFSTTGKNAAGVAGTLTWSSTNATSCAGTGFNTGGATSGTVPTGILAANTNYSVSCSGAVANTTVMVTSPSATITANPTRVNPGAHSSLTWSTTLCTNVAVTGTNGFSSTASSSTNVDSGAIGAHGDTFTVTCDAGAATASVQVNVPPQFDEF